MLERVYENGRILTFVFWYLCAFGMLLGTGWSTVNHRMVRHSWARWWGYEKVIKTFLVGYQNESEP